MNILFISTLYPVNTGDYESEIITRALHDFVKEWNKENNVQVIRPLINNLNPLNNYQYYPKDVVKPGDYLIDEVNISAIPVYRIPKAEIYVFHHINRFLKNTKIKFDVIVSHSNPSIMIAAKLSKKLNIPLISGIHISDILILNKDNVQKQKLVKCLKQSSGIACRAPHILRSMKNMNIVDDKIIFPAYSGINKDIILQRSSLNDKNDFSNGKINISTVCSLIKRKNLDVILKALKDLAFPWTLHIVGAGDQMPYLEELAAKLQINTNVHFYGQLPHRDTLRILEQSLLFILPSSDETFGLAYLEAMAKGNIVIGSIGTGIDGIIKNNYNGYLVSPKNVEELSDLIRHIIFHEKGQKLEEILSNSFSTVSHMTHALMAKQYLNNILNIIQK